MTQLFSQEVGAPYSYWKLEFGERGNSQSQQAGGWSAAEANFTWSSGHESRLRIHLPNIIDDLYLIVRGEPFRHYPELTSQELIFFLEGKEIFRTTVDQKCAIPIKLRSDVRLVDNLLLSVQYPNAAQPSSFDLGDSRYLAFAWHSLELVSLPELDISEFLADVCSKSTLRVDGVVQTLATWALRETACWRAVGLDRNDVNRSFLLLNNKEHCYAVYRFIGSNVDLLKKSVNTVDAVALNRAQLYLAFFRSVIQRFRADYSSMICFNVGDMPRGDVDSPVFGFQKSTGQTPILAPDIEFLEFEYYEDSKFLDTNLYEEKSISAVFAGATTGGEITLNTAISSGLPRLEAAHFFQAHPTRVDFRLPDVVQCATPEVKAYLSDKEFCKRSRLTWQQQYSHRFLISIDGNGATCSRVVLALKSQSVLLKYNSNNVLYYFGGLEPQVHFVPISEHADVLRVIAIEQNMPLAYQHLARSATEFAQSYLSRSRVEEYMLLLLFAYQRCFR